MRERLAGLVAITLALLLTSLSPSLSQETTENPVPDTPPARRIAPAADLEVVDRPLDAGTALRISFARSPDAPMGTDAVERYALLRRGPEDAEFQEIRSFPAKVLEEGFSYEDGTVSPGNEYRYQVRLFTQDGQAIDGAVIGPVSPERQYFFTTKLNTLIATLLFVGLVLGFIHVAKSGKDLFLRRIAGLDAIDEAVGRCTEMGKPVLYVPGISTISDVATIASLNILGQVAKKIAAYQSRIMVPNRDPIVYPVTQDVVKLAYTEAGFPQDYRDDDVYFVTNDQFSYAAAVCGTMVREKPGANLLLGMFYAESLVLAETGASIGAIQIAGTDAVTQLPFFVTACDYTIIGEELYAASAYIGREPTLLGSLKGQDYFKLVLLILMALGAVSLTIGVFIEGSTLDWVTQMLRVRSAGG